MTVYTRWFPLVLALSLALGGLGVALWILTRPAVPVPRRDIALVADLSASAVPGALCSDLSAALEATRPGRGVVLGLRLFVTGDPGTGWEPTRFGPWEETPSHLVMHTRQRRAPAAWAPLATADAAPGAAADGVAADASRAAPFSAAANPDVATLLQDTCAALPSTRDTPLFRAVRMALEELVSVPESPPNREARLVVRSDLVEEEDATLIERIRGEDPGQPPRLDNAGVEVVFCGITQRRVLPRSRLPSAQQLSDAWRAEFTMPKLVRFHAGCP